MLLADPETLGILAIPGVGVTASRSSRRWQPFLMSQVDEPGVVAAHSSLDLGAEAQLGAPDGT